MGHEIDQGRDRVLQPDAAAGLLQMLAAHTSEFRIMADQVGEFTALLNEMAAGETGHSLLESLDAEKLGEHHARILEAQGLVEIRGEEIMTKRCAHTEASLLGGAFHNTERPADVTRQRIVEAAIYFIRSMRDP
jgi:hypothetical protein